MRNDTALQILTEHRQIQERIHVETRKCVTVSQACDEDARDYWLRI